MTNTPPPAPQCPEAGKLSYAHIGKLNMICKEPADVDRLIQHIRSCAYCAWLHEQKTQEQSVVGSPDMRIFPPKTP